MQLSKSFVLLCMLLVGTLLYAQEKKTVTGVVQDSKGGALPNAAIREKGTTNTVMTNERGQFTIRISPNATLQVSYVGYTPTEIATGSGAVYTVTLQEKGEMQEVVVTSLGLSKQQKSLGYSVSTVKAEQLTQAGSPNFASALYGKAPGVRIGTTPGGATSAVNISIRGINSITGKNQPLIVLDGIPIRDGEANNGNYWGDQRLRGNGLLDINPEDIESVSILKGASAAALYGSEAVNGVVLITTKSGKGKKGFSVDIAANYSHDEVAYLPRYQNVRGPGAPKNVNNAGQDDEGFIYQDLDGDGVKETRGVLGFTINYGPKFDGKPTVGWDGIVRPYEAQKNNYKGLYRGANNSSVSVSMTQASENSNIRFSLTRQDNQGVSLGAENSKNIANLNSSFRISNKVTTDVMINYINQHTGNRPYSIDRMINNFTGMMGRFENADMYLNKYKTSRGYRFVTGTNQSLTPKENITLPGFKGDIADYVWRVKEYNEDEWSNRVIGSITTNYQILRDLKLRGRIATDFTSERTESRNSTEIPLVFGNSGYYANRTFQSTIFYGDALLTYTRKIIPDLEMNVMGGYTATETKAIGVQRETNGGLSVENWFDMKASCNTPGASDQFNFRNRLVRDAFVGTINGNYKDYLYLEGTFRRERISTMHPDNNSNTYYSVNSGFVFSDAFQLPSFINYGKLRASWGTVGNYPDIYAANIAYSQNTLGVQQSGGQAVLYTTLPNSFGNDAIRPEQKNEIEFGLEAKFLNNRLGIDVSYYNGQIRDQILPITIPGSTGATSILTNIGTLRNKGLEIALTGAPVRTRDFKWDAGINFAFNKNTVEKLADGSDQLIHADYDGNAAQLISKVGQPMGDFYVHPIAKTAKGDPIVNPDGLYKLDDKLVKAGNAMPKMVGGVFSSFSYKNFSLDVLADFRFGGYVMPTGINWMISRGLLEESLNYMDKEHGGMSYYVNAQGKGVATTAAAGPNGEKVLNDGMLMSGVLANGDPNANVISQAYYYWNTYNWGGPQYSSSRYELYVKKNSYIKMREISLAYSLPAKVAGKVGFKKVQLSVFGRNLFYVYRTLKDLDAEQTVAGSRWFQSLTNAGTNPSTRTFGVMLRAGL